MANPCMCAVAIMLLWMWNLTLLILFEVCQGFIRLQNHVLVPQNTVSDASLMQHVHTMTLANSECANNYAGTDMLNNCPDAG